MPVEEGGEPGRQGHRDAFPEPRAGQPGRVGGVAHVAALDEDLGHGGQVQAAQVGAHVQPSRADVVGVGLAGDPVVGVPDVDGEPAGQPDDRGVRGPGDAARGDHLEPGAGGRPAVGVDGDGRVRVGPVADRRALGHAGADPVVVVAGQDHRGAFGPEQPGQPHRDVEGEGVLGIARVGLRPGGVAGLPFRDHVDQPVDDRRMRPVGAVVPGVQGDDLAGQGLGRGRAGARVPAGAGRRCGSAAGVAGVRPSRGQACCPGPGAGCGTGCRAAGAAALAAALGEGWLPAGRAAPLTPAQPVSPARNTARTPATRISRAGHDGASSGTPVSWASGPPVRSGPIQHEGTPLAHPLRGGSASAEAGLLPAARHRAAGGRPAGQARRGLSRELTGGPSGQLRGHGVGDAAPAGCISRPVGRRGQPSGDLAGGMRGRGRFLPGTRRRRVTGSGGRRVARSGQPATRPERWPGSLPARRASHPARMACLLEPARASPARQARQAPIRAGGPAPGRRPGRRSRATGHPRVFSRDLIASHLVLTRQRRFFTVPRLPGWRIAVVYVPGRRVAIRRLPGSRLPGSHLPGSRLPGSDVLVPHVLVPPLAGLHPVVPHILAQGVPARCAVRARGAVRAWSGRAALPDGEPRTGRPRCRARRTVRPRHTACLRRTAGARSGPRSHPPPEFIGQPQLTGRLQVMRATRAAQLRPATLPRPGPGPEVVPARPAEPDQPGRDQLNRASTVQLLPALAELRWPALHGDPPAYIVEQALVVPRSGYPWSW